MAKTSIEAKRHVEALANFFFGGSMGGLDQLFEKYEKRKYIRQTIERLEKRGLIVRKKNQLIPTKAGWIFFRRKRTIKIEKQKWDGMWYIVSFDIPVYANKKRYVLNDLLIKHRFIPLQKSVWISPASISKDFWESVMGVELDKFCKIMSVKIMDGDEELKERFKDVVDFS